jgi:sigma-B regulation protein RsbU (phosphoserine phosphatase)
LSTTIRTIVEAPAKYAQERQKFLTEFGYLAEPVALSLGINLFYETELSRIQLINGEDSDCIDRSSTYAMQTNCGEHREHDFIDVIYEGNALGRIIICYQKNMPNGKVSIERLIEAALNKVIMESQEESWLEELSVCWESLDTLYEISTDLKVLQNPRKVLRRIMDKAVSIQEGLKAIFWIKNDETLEPISRKNTTHIQKKTNTDSLVHRAVADGKTHLINSRAHIAEFHITDPELARATSVIVVPIATRHAVLGAIEIWSEQNSGKELDSRTKRLVEALTYQGAIVVENDRLMRESIENAKLLQEVEIGSKIQQTLLLGQAPTNFSGLKIAAMSIPSQHIDGDFYDFIKHDEQCLDVIVGDVMGKGIPAALLGAGTKSQFLRAAGQLLNTSDTLRLPAPQEIVYQVHTKLTKQYMEFDSFVTICFARFDTKNCRLTFVDCGHTKTVHYQRATNSYTFLEGDNMPLGFLVEEVYQQVETEFASGDLFLFYSDGVTEAKNLQGEMFGERRLADCVQAYQDLEPDEILQKIRNIVTEFTNSEKLADDFTCVAIKINDLNDEAVTESTRLAETQHVVSTEMKLELESDLAELVRVRNFLDQACSALFDFQVDTDLVDQLKLAVNEAVTNVILHGYKSESNKKIEIQVSTLNDFLQIQLQHQGISFEPNNVRLPSFDGSRDGGFGVFIIASIMDDVQYFRDSFGNNFITMTKKIYRG